MKFPLVGSAMLFGLFLAFKFLPKDLVNLVLSVYFVFLGTMGLVATLEPLVAPIFPKGISENAKVARVPSIPIILTEGAEISLTPLEILLIIPSSGFCWWYWTQKHWIANNVLGLAFSLQGIEHLSLGAVQNGVILLCGLFFYDVFWVFCTPVMVSVAKSFEAPIKLLFPRFPSPANGASPFAMLGLGDIVIPGIFVAIVLRYDVVHGSKYFYSAFSGYAAGLVATIAVMNIFQAAQPALLYIVPAVLMTTFGHAAVHKEASKVFHWKEKEEEKEEEEECVDGLQTPPKSGKAVGESKDGEQRLTRSAAKAAKKDA